MHYEDMDLDSLVKLSFLQEQLVHHRKLHFLLLLKNFKFQYKLNFMFDKKTPEKVEL